ncbi:MAG TPA: 50S ribosomal protein L15 [Euryarchaeota archaeon]|nr:50S ribosomal protein L15 [Euryarchaeota archaeon]
MVSRTSKFRGSRTHGRGKKAGRGAGLRGGRGGAGLHKHKYISIVKYDPDHFGQKGFKRPQSVVAQNITINLSELEQNLDRFKTMGIAEMRSERMVVDLEKAGIDKLLGSGKISTQVDVIVGDASSRAKEKLESAGGKLISEEAAGAEEKTEDTQ